MTGETGIGGITTSGLGGRSLTLGVADSVVALSSDATRADACSTLIANYTDVAHPAVHREPATLVEASTDIPGRWVTRAVGNLPLWAIEQAMTAGLGKTAELIEKGLVQGAVIVIKGETGWIPENLDLLFSVTK